MLTVNRRATGQRIKKLIKEKGLKYRQVAEMMDTNERVVQSLTQGRHMPSINTMAKLIQILDCGFDDLICLSVGEKE